MPVITRSQAKSNAGCTCVPDATRVPAQAKRPRQAKKHKNIDVALNLTTGEWFKYDDFRVYEIFIYGLINKLETRNAIITEDIGGSHWKKSDKIVIVPHHLHEYVFDKYAELFVDELLSIYF